jgi:hypothetical protein
MSNGKMAEREIKRKEEIEKTLDYIYRQLGQLTGIQSLPDSVVPPQALINRATDVKSAVLVYVAVHIRYEGIRCGIIGMYASGKG